MAKKKYCGHTKLMMAKWIELRPDKPMSMSALTTKGKRLYERALKDNGGKNGWIGLEEMRKIEQQVYEVVGGEEPVLSSPDVNLLDGGNERGSENGQTEESGEYLDLRERARGLFFELKGADVNEQCRRKLRKKRVSMEREKWANMIVDELWSELCEGEKKDISIINTLIYAVAEVCTYKKGDESGQGGGGRGGVRTEPGWMTRIKNNILKARKEADVLSAHLRKQVKSKKALSFVNSVLKKYGADGSKPSMEKVIFQIKNRISVLSKKLQRYDVQEKAKRQNEAFAKNKKSFYNSLDSEKIEVDKPPSEEDIRAFWGESIFGRDIPFSENVGWMPEWRKKYEGIPCQEWQCIGGRR